ncbi:phytoene desaturase [Bowdeniella nasicola]|uniref:Phytoene desaturase n=1 Tax=Bowdeniella nasicola TaxID=208480 RepID=A0A1H3VEP8_9ACTO|nr:phytoene desaturase family protein [Bowdeniella nasicola]SDZ73141.1 phytoene desaturase [Bowdeniella nasicola]
MTRTVIIGAGLGGLATAALLAREGREVVVLEKNADIGGRIGNLETAGFRFDTGPSWYLMPEVMEHFFNLLGTSTDHELRLRPLQPAYQVVSEPGASRVPPVTIPRGVEHVARTFEALERGGGAKLRRYLSSARRTYDMALRYFLYNPFTRYRTLISPEILRGSPTLVRLLGQSLERYINSRFSHPVLRQILGFHAVFIGTSPMAAPAMYHLMSYMDLDQGVFYPEGGFTTLTDRIAHHARAAGARIVTGAEVTGIDTVPGRGRKHRVRQVRWCDEAGEIHHEPADVVVSNADLHHTETQLLKPQQQTYPERWWRRRTSGPSAVIAYLGVRGELPQLQHHNLFFTRDWHTNFEAIFGNNQRFVDPASLYVCKASATDPSVAPPGHENLFILIPGPPDLTVGSGGADGGGDEQVELIADRAIDQIAQWSDIPDLRERIVMRQTLGPCDYQRDFHSWQGSMLGPAHILSQSAMFRAQNQSTKVDGLYYVGATTAPGIGVPMCLISAEVVLKRIRGDHSAGPIPVVED